MLYCVVLRLGDWEIEGKEEEKVSPSNVSQVVGKGLGGTDWPNVVSRRKKSRGPRVLLSHVSEPVISSRELDFLLNRRLC